MNDITGSLVGYTFLSEFMGSLLLILIGNGVMALSSLKSFRVQPGWTGGAMAWGLAVFIGAIVGGFSGGHINFAVSIGVLIESISAENVFTGKQIMILVYLAAQFLGMFVGQLFVDLVYWLQIAKETDPLAVLKMHAAAPNQPERTPKTYGFNFITEVVATFVLVLGVSAAGFYTGAGAGEQGTAASTAVQLLPGAFVASLIVIGIGLGLGGPTGYTINPTRDLAPRLVHQILKFKFPAKGSSDWMYSSVSVTGPIVGGLLAGAMALVFYL